MDAEQLHTQRKLLTEALRDSRRVSAIKAVRAMTGAGLLEAKTVVDALFDYAAISIAADVPTAAQEQSAHYVVCLSADGGTDYVNHYRGHYDNRDEAMDYARSRVDCDNLQVTVAKVIATTKRTLVTL